MQSQDIRGWLYKRRQQKQVLRQAGMVFWATFAASDYDDRSGKEFQISKLPFSDYASG